MGFTDVSEGRDASTYMKTYSPTEERTHYTKRFKNP